MFESAFQNTQGTRGNNQVLVPIRGFPFISLPHPLLFLPLFRSPTKHTSDPIRVVPPFRPVCPPSTPPFGQPFCLNMLEGKTFVDSHSSPFPLFYSSTCIWDPHPAMSSKLLHLRSFYLLIGFGQALSVKCCIVKGAVVIILVPMRRTEHESTSALKPQ